MSGGRSRPLTALLLLLAAALSPGCERRPQFGYDFESGEILEKLDWMCRTLYRISEEHATSGKSSLEVSMYPAAEGDTEHFPGVYLWGFDPDWSGRRALVFDAHNPAADPLPLVVSVADREAPEDGDLFTRTWTLAPGDNRVSIPVSSLVTPGTRRRLDLGKIRAVGLFLANPRERHTLYLDRVLLE